MKIQSGTGNGDYGMEVSIKNRALVESVSENEITFLSEEEGQAYIFASGPFTNITTTGTEHGFLYLKNTSTTKQLHIQSIRTCGETIQKWRVYIDATTGTLISGASSGNKNNMNLTSANTPDADLFKGSNGSTLTNGTMIEHWINGIGHSVENLEGSLILGKDDTLSLTLETDTAGDFCSRIIAYYK